MIRFPDAEDRSEIDATLRLSAAASKKLWTRVFELVEEIARHESWMAEMAQGRNRKELLRHIRNLSNILKKMSARLADRDRNTDLFLKQQLGGTLGELLSHRGFEQLIQISPGHTIDYRFSLDREEVARDADFYQALEAEMLSRRINLGKQMAPELLIALGRALNEPLTRFLELERKNRGGSPGQLYRNFVVQELAMVYRAVTGKSPTATPKGGFATMCDPVLAAMHLPTDGVEKVIARLVKRLRVR